MFINTIDGPANRGRNLRQFKVFLNRKTRDDASIFRYQSDASLRGFVGFHFMQGLMIEPDLAVCDLWTVDTGNGTQC